MRIAITCGDPSGVGPEVVAAWMGAAPAEGLEYVVFGPRSWLDTLPERPDVRSEPVGPSGFRAEAGRPSDAGCRVAWEAMEAAAAGGRAGDFAAVVTAPIAKAGMRRVGYPFPGQSEFFADRWGGDPTMAFTGGRLRVALATWHIPLRDVPESLTRAVIDRTVRHAWWLARAEGCPVPRIAVCGLNPHAGEEGMLGREEAERIDPWIEALAPRFPGLSRCLPADTVFARMLRGDFDVVAALYHDQGLGPLKTVDFDTAVNVTLGMPRVRTSPDHGTAYDIAGRGVARATSFTNAVAVAARLARFAAEHPMG